VQRRERVSRWNRPVVVGLLPNERHRVPSAGEGEAHLLRVPEVADEDVLEGDRLVQPAQLEGRLIEIEEPGGETRVVVEERVLMRGAVGEAPSQAAVRAHPLEDEPCGGPGALDVARIAEDGPGAGEGRDHEAVPAGE